MTCPHLAIVSAGQGEPLWICTHALQHRHQPGLAPREVTPQVCAGCVIRQLPSAEPQAILTAEEIQAEREAWQARPPLAAAAGIDRDQCRYRGAAPVRYEDRKLCGQSGKEPVYSCAVHGECTLSRCRAGRRLACCLGCPDFAAPIPWLADTMFAITAFERPRHLQRLVASIERFYPAARIVVADNGSDERKAVLPPGVEAHNIEFDCGLSAARHFLVERFLHERLRYFLLLEEDFVFTAETCLERFVEILEHDGELGSIGGALRFNGAVHDYDVDLELFRGQVRGSRSRHPIRATSSGLTYQVCDKHYNFGLWRREMLRDHSWDELPKLGEHTPYFLRVKHGQKWHCAHTSSVVADHDLTGRSLTYQRHRSRAGPMLTEWLSSNGAAEGTSLSALDAFRRGARRVRPHVVILGVGHSGTSILAQMLHAAGWGAADADEKYGESVSVRTLNQQAIKSGRFDATAAAGVLAALGREPWAIKDPRFVRMLPQWMPVFVRMPEPPLLALLTRDHDALRTSFERRGEWHDGKPSIAYMQGKTLRELQADAEQHFDAWPWTKLRLSYESLAAAAAMFDRQGRG